MNEAANQLQGAHEARQTDTARRAGRGVLLITGSKIYFLIAGYAGQLLLPRLFAGPEMFGLFSTAMSSVSILNNVIVGATVQVVSKRVSEAVERSQLTLRQAIAVQLWLGLGLAALLFATLSQGGLAVNALVPKQMVDVLQAVVILAVSTSVPEVRRLLRNARRSVES